MSLGEFWIEWATRMVYRPGPPGNFYPFIYSSVIEARYGLFFLDGHADFYHPEASATGAVSDMDLALVSGRGPDVLSDIEGRRPLVRDEDVVVFGYRDAEEATRYGSPDVRETEMRVYDLAAVRGLGTENAAAQALNGLLARGDVAGFWIHLDADVLDDAAMPAVDYRLPDGLTPDELSAVLRALLKSGRAVGLEVASPSSQMNLRRCITQSPETPAAGATAGS